MTSQLHKRRRDGYDSAQHDLWLRRKHGGSGSGSPVFGPGVDWIEGVGLQGGGPVGVAPTDITLSASSVAENAAIGSLVATISADGSPSPTFSIVADPDAKFAVSGGLLLLDDVLDFATATSHSVTIRATNSAGTYDEAFVITVTDVDEGAGDVAPTDIALSATSVSEDAALGTVIATISANGSPSPTYSIVADPDSKFSISGTQLLLNGALDYATATSHSVTIRATNAGGTYDEAFVISVTEVVAATNVWLINGGAPIRHNEQRLYAGAALPTDAPPLEPETNTYIAAMNVAPNQTRQQLLDDLVFGLQKDGVWDDWSHLYAFAAHGSQPALLSLKAPAGTPALAVNSPTFTASRGFQGNGTTSYVDTQQSVATILSGFLVLNINPSAANSDVMGTSAAARRMRLGTGGGGNVAWNSSTNVSIGSTDSFKGFVKNAAGFLTTYDGTTANVGSVTDAATGTNPVWFLRGPGGYSAARISFGGLSSAVISAAGMAATRTRVRTYLSAIGAL